MIGNQFRDSFNLLSDEERVMIKHLYVAGDGVKTIAAALEVSPATVRRWLHLMDVPSHPTGRPPRKKNR